jgi:hypothetical protein
MLAVHSDTPLIRRCRQEVLSLARASIGRCLDAARASLEDAVRASRSVAAHYGLQDALDALEQRRAAMLSAFPAALDQAIAQALDAAGEPPGQAQHGQPGTLPSETELALLDDNELSHFVEISRLVQIVQPVVEHALTRLDTLMSSVLQQPVVRPELNPMRPQVLCHALMRMLGEHSESTEVRRLWLRHIAKSYAKALGDLYGAIGDLLERESVQQAQYRIRLTEGGAGPTVIVGEGAVPSAPMTAGGYLLTGTPVMLGTVPGVLHAGLMQWMGLREPAGEFDDDWSDEDAIRRRRAPVSSMAETAPAQAGWAVAPQIVLRDFLHSPQLAPQYDAPLPPEYYAAVQRHLAQMAAAPVPAYDEAAWLDEQARLRALAVDERPAQVVTPQMFLPPQQWGQQAASPQMRERTAMEIKAQAVKVSQALGVHAVQALVAQVASDQRLLAPVRQAVVALEPALLRLALAEPRFFGDDAHPARCFIEAIAQRSFKYNDEFSSAFAAFFEPVRQAVCVLDALSELSGADFDRALKALQGRWQAQDQTGQQAGQQSLRTMALAQQRQQLADKIARDLSLRADLAGVPTVMADFLFKDWALVIAHAQLTHEGRELDPGGYLSIVTDLLWSVKQDQILHDIPRLFEVVPRLIATLRKGLDMLDKAPGETQALFDMLLRFHEPVLKLRRIRSALDRGIKPEELAAMLQLPREKDLIGPGQPPQIFAAQHPWLGRHEQAATGFMDAPTDGAGLVSLTGLAALRGATLAGGIAPLAVDSLAQGASPAAAISAPDCGPKQPVQPVRLRAGDWVDLRLEQQWQRAELTWVSDNHALYLFVSPGARVHSMTRHTLEKLLSSGHIRPSESGAVLDKALQAIAR